MPEQISKYPDVTLQVLKGAGARCGEGAEQKILTQCPSERFCSLPTGEICVYGVEEVPKMTQITVDELAQAIGTAVRRPALDTGFPSALNFAFLGIALLAGLLIGRFWRN